MNNLEYIPNDYARGYVASMFDSRKGVYVPLSFIDICDGNLYDALLFAQIMYWHEPSKDDGKTRLRYWHDGQLWIAKNHSAWFVECRIKAQTVRKCLERLKEMNLIYYELHGASGNVTPYMRVNWDVFEQKMKAWESHKTPVPKNTPPVTVEQGGMLQENSPLLPQVISNTENTTKNINKENTPLPPEGEVNDKTPDTEYSSMNDAVKSLLKQHNKTQRASITNALLQRHTGTKADMNTASKLTVEQLNQFCLWWDESKKGRDGKSLTRPKNQGSIKQWVDEWLSEQQTTNDTSTTNTQTRDIREIFKGRYLPTNTGE